MLHWKSTRDAMKTAQISKPENRHLSRFELHFGQSTEPGFSPRPSQATIHVRQEIHIDGLPLEKEHSVDLIQLISSLLSPGEFDIFTCACGASGCASIWEGVRVRHSPRIVGWRLKTPFSGKDFEEVKNW